jgi:hypothetical protein
MACESYVMTKPNVTHHSEWLAFLGRWRSSKIVYVGILSCIDVSVLIIMFGVNVQLIRSGLKFHSPIGLCCGAQVLRVADEQWVLPSVAQAYRYIGIAIGLSI